MRRILERRPEIQEPIRILQVGPGRDTFMYMWLRTWLTRVLGKDGARLFLEDHPVFFSSSLCSCLFHVTPYDLLVKLFRPHAFDADADAHAVVMSTSWHCTSHELTVLHAEGARS